MQRIDTAAAQSRLSFAQCLAWGAGGFADNLIAWTIVYLAMPIYNIALGVDPVVIGWAIALPRLLDAIIDPLAGHWSDNFRSRWGRRKPFILVGGGLSTLFFMATWFPPVGSSPKVAAIFFILTTFLYLGMYAFFSIPYYALGVELTTDYHERTRVQSWRFFFAAIAQLSMPWFYKTAFWVGTHRPIANAEPEVAGIRYVGLAAGSLVLAILVLIALCCREPKRVQHQPYIRILDAFRWTFKNDAYVKLALVTFSVLFGFFVVNPMALYLSIYYVCNGDKGLAATISGWSGTMVGILGVLALAPLTALSHRFGKKQVLIGGQVVALLGFTSLWFLLTPEHPYWGIIPWIIIAPGQLAVWVIGSSISSDIIDLDELETGCRREGMYGAVTAMLNKWGVGLSSMLSGYIIVWSGFVNDVFPSAEVLWRMRVLYVSIPIAFVVLSLAISFTLPVSAERMREVREILDRRHAEAERQLTDAV